MEIQFVPTKVFPVKSIKDNYNNYKNKFDNMRQMNFLSFNGSNIFNSKKEDQNKYQIYDLNNNQILFVEQLTNIIENKNQLNSYQNQMEEQKLPQKNFKPQNQMIFVDDLI